MRWLGFLLIVAAACGLGHVLALERERRIRELAHLVHALEHLQTEVVYGLVYLHEALRRAGESAGSCRSLFTLAARALEEGSPAHEAWSAALRASRRALALEAEDWSILERLGPVLGLSAAEDQRRHLVRVRTELERRQAEALARLAQSTRLLRTLGACGGVALALLLV